jgi:hypothetical protein
MQGTPGHVNFNICDDIPPIKTRYP